MVEDRRNDMKNKKITRKITQGMYVLTTKGGGCIVDAVAQISAGDNPLISVAVMHSNYTNTLLKENTSFALSVLGKNVDPDIINIFGMQSMRNVDKLKEIENTEIEGLPIINDTIGYMICEIVDRIENDTHTLVIGKLIEADMYKEEETMSYQYYQEHKEELLKVTTDKGKTAWICTICGYIYYGEELPEDYVCPKCGVAKELFQKKEN